MLMVLLTPASLRMAITADGEELEAFSEACKRGFGADRLARSTKFIDMSLETLLPRQDCRMDSCRKHT